MDEFQTNEKNDRRYAPTKGNQECSKDCKEEIEIEIEDIEDIEDVPTISPRCH